MNQLVSIIVPVYNGEKYIDDCINSILNQTYKNIELIVINDGSTDNTCNILNKFSDSRIKIINQKNKGVSNARNNGLKNIKGDYVCFVDADDKLCIDYIETHIKILDKDKSQISTFMQPMKFNSNTNMDNEKFKFKDSFIKNGTEAAEYMLLYKIAIGPWNKLISTKLIFDNNITFNENLCYGEGFNFSIDCFLKADKVSISDNFLYLYRIDNNQSVMTKFSLKQIYGNIDAQLVLQDKLNGFSKLLIPCKYANWHTYCDCLNSIIGCHEEKNMEKDLQNIIKICKNDSKIGLKLDINKKEKFKCVLYSINPIFAAKVINKLRKRKF